MGQVQTELNALLDRRYKNTDQFREPALHFMEHGYYTPEREGSDGYNEYFELHMERSLNGWTSPDGQYITGFHYFYLNFCPIGRLTMVQTKDGAFRPKRERNFPEFYSYDAAYFGYIEMCQRLGKHGIVLKARRKGYSYKNASMLIRNYFLMRESKGFVFATDVKYLLQDGFLTKAWDYMDFIDEHTAWRKLRQKKSTELHRRASYVEKDRTGNPIEKGFKSEIMGATIGDNPNKARGIRGELIFFEEGGSFGKLEEAVSICRPSVEQDGTVDGTIVVFGTASLDNENMQPLSRMFLNPESYNMLGMPNRWDDFSRGKECGFFHPYYENIGLCDQKTGKRLLMDADGNTLKKKGVDWCMSEREKVVRNANSQRVVDAHLIEYPMTPSDALTVYKSSIFPREALRQQWVKVQSDPAIRNRKRVGHLGMKDGKPYWVEHAADDSIQSYHLGHNDAVHGALTVWEFPPENPKMNTFIIGVDSYDFDTAKWSDSLGSCLVYKREHITKGDESEYVCAEYTGRPEMAEHFYENVRRIALFYNAKIMHENNNKGIYTYFLNRHVDYLMADQPDCIDKALDREPTTSRKKGVAASSKNVRNVMNGWIKSQLLEEYEEGKTNIDHIYSAALLEELMEWNEDGNFDRVAALGCVMTFRQQIWNVHNPTPEDMRVKKAMVPPLFTPEYYREEVDLPEFLKFIRN